MISSYSLVEVLSQTQPIPNTACSGCQTACQAFWEARSPAKGKALGRPTKHHVASHTLACCMTKYTLCRAAVAVRGKPYHSEQLLNAPLLAVQALIDVPIDFSGSGARWYLATTMVR